jgi:hypothetical protein
LVTQSYSLHEMVATAFRTARKRPQITSTTQEIELYKLMSNFPDPTQHRPISDVPVVQTVRTLRLLQQQRPTILHSFKTPPKTTKTKVVVARNHGRSHVSQLMMPTTHVSGNFTITIMHFSMHLHANFQRSTWNFSKLQTGSASMSQSNLAVLKI